MGDDERLGERQPDDGRRQVNVENESFDVAIGVRDEHGNFFPLSLSPGSGILALDAVLKLLDPSGDLVTARSDEQRLLRNRPYEPYRVVAPVNLGAAWATVYTVPADSIDRVWVRFGQTTAGTVDFAAALRVNGIVMGTSIPVYVDSPPPVFGPFTMEAADIIEAYRTGGANGAVSFDVERYSTGDTNTGV